MQTAEPYPAPNTEALLESLAEESTEVPASEESMINPGDKFGEMEITTAEQWDWDNNLNMCKEGKYSDEEFQAADEIECEVLAGAQIIFNCAGACADSLDEVEAAWPEQKIDLAFDGQAINLPPFGVLEWQYGDNCRIWNVMVKNMTPGEHTLYCAHQNEDDEFFEKTYRFIISEPSKLEVPPGAADMLFRGQSDRFSNLAEFYDLLQNAVDDGQLYAVWNPVKATGQMPLIFGDYAVFLYRGEGSQVQWKGLYLAEPYTHMGSSDLWVMMRPFEADATIDYMIAVDNEEMLDPLNPLQQGGFFPHSVLRMPEYVYPQETLYREDIAHGALTENILVSSERLGYDKFYRVYTPPGYESMESLPVVYVTDGTDAISETYLGMVNVLDNLIADGRIEPVIAVFIDPHNAATGEYVRGVEQAPVNVETCPFCDFVTEELVPLIDANYKSDPSANARALLGTSLGGQWAAYMGLAHNDLFHLIGMQSFPAPDGHWILQGYRQAGELPISVFLHHGTYDTGTAPLLADVLREKGVPLNYIETHGGHAHGSWRATTDDMLVTFFGI